MLGFLEWVEFNRKKQKKERKDERTTSQSGQADRINDDEGEIVGNNQKIEPAVFQFFTEPK